MQLRCVFNMRAQCGPAGSMLEESCVWKVREDHISGG